MIRATRNPFPLNRKFKTGPQLGPLYPASLLDEIRGDLSVSCFSREGRENRKPARTP